MKTKRNTLVEFIELFDMTNGVSAQSERQLIAHSTQTQHL